MTNKEVFVRLEKQSQEFIEAFAEEFQARVEQKTPVKTGALQAGYSTQVTPVGFGLFNTQNYFEYVENGTARMAPRRMVARTMMEAPTIAKNALEKTK